MSEDMILTSEEGNKYSFEKLQTNNINLGKVMGAEGAADYLMDRAKSLFESGDDDEAKVYRTAAKLVHGHFAVVLRREYESHMRQFPHMTRKDEQNDSE